MISGQSLTCPKGASLTFEIDMDTGSDLTGATAQWALCESWLDNAKVYLTKTGVGDGLFIGQDGGVWKITVNLAPTDTLDIPSGLLYHDCKVLLQSGDVEDVANGPFSLDPSVNILLTNTPITRNLQATQSLRGVGQTTALTSGGSSGFAQTLGALNQTAIATAGASLALDHFASDGATYPWYASTSTPVGRYETSTNTTWVTWEGWTGTARVVRIATYNHSSALWSPTYIVATNTLTDDDHGAPSICRDADGYHHIFYGAHNTAIRHTATTSPDDPSSWSEQSTIGTNLTYPNPIVIGSILYLFCRGDGSAADTALILYKSTSVTSGVVTWSAPQAIADMGGERFYQGPHLLRSGKIHIPATRSDNADTYRRDIYYLIYDPSTGSVANLDGSVTTVSGSLPIARSDLDISYMILAQPTPTSHANIPSVCYDTAGALHLLYLDEPVAGTINLYHKAYAAGSWNSPVLLGTVTARYTDFLVVPNNANGVDGYWSSKPGTRFTNGGDLRRATRSSGGTWGGSSILRTATAYPIGEPTAIRNAHANARLIFSEISDTAAPAVGTLRGWLYGDAGYVTRLWASSFSPPTTWSPTDSVIAPHFTFSNDLLTVTNVEGNFLVRTTNFIDTTERKYFEIVITSMTVVGDTAIGVSTVNQNMTNYLSDSNEGIGHFGNGRVYLNDVLLSTIQTYATGDNIGMAIDRPNNKIWFRKNGGNWDNDVTHDPATNTGGFNITVVAGKLWPIVWGAHPTDSFTGKFNNGSWANAAPSGFTQIVGQ